MQRQTLRRMGVEVWRRRDAPREVAPESSAAPALMQSAPADSPQSNLARIGEEVAACQKCELHKSRKNTVFGCGDARADWMFIGEAPGKTRICRVCLSSAAPENCWTK